MIHSHLMKVVIMGDSNVGKTGLLYQYIHDKFIRDYDMTIGVDYGSKVINVDGLNIKLQVWDTAGQERFSSITRSYCRNAHAIIFMYDVTNKASFTNLDKHLKLIEEYSHHAHIDSVCMIVGNKIDRVDERIVQTDKGASYAETNNCLFQETSVKSNVNVSEIFHCLVRNIVQYKFQDLIVNKSFTVDIANKNQEQLNNRCLPTCFQ